MANMGQFEVSSIIENGLDRANRIIYFGGESEMASEDNSTTNDVGMLTVEKAIRNLHILVNESKTKPIELHMISWGGCPYSALRMVDEIQCCPCQIKFVGGGVISSSATWIMAVCDVRQLHKNTIVLLHDGNDGWDGKHTDTVIAVRHFKDLQNRLDKIFAENSRMPVEYWQDILQRDVWIFAEDAIMLGLADSIIEYKKRGNLRKARQAALKKEIDTATLKETVNRIYKNIDKKSVKSININVPKKEPIDKNIIVEEVKDGLADISGIQTTTPESVETTSDAPKVQQP